MPFPANTGQRAGLLRSCSGPAFSLPRVGSIVYVLQSISGERPASMLFELVINRTVSEEII